MRPRILPKERGVKWGRPVPKRKASTEWPGTGIICAKEPGHMRFGIFGSAQAKRGGPDVDSGAGFREFVDYNVEAEALGYQSSFVVEHHFTGFGQISATLNLLTWVAA